MKRTMLGLALVTALGALVSDAGSAPPRMRRLRSICAWAIGIVSRAAHTCTAGTHVPSGPTGLSRSMYSVIGCIATGETTEISAEL
jgi:hypothetical protein